MPLAAMPARLGADAVARFVRPHGPEAVVKNFVEHGGLAHATSAELVLSFDGHCGLCKHLTKWIARHDAAGRIQAIPSQMIETSVAKVSVADLAAKSWAFDAAGRKFGGAAAINQVFAKVGGFWAGVAKAYQVGPIGRLEERIYAYVSAHRPAFASTLRRIFPT